MLFQIIVAALLVADAGAASQSDHRVLGDPLVAQVFDYCGAPEADPALEQAIDSALAPDAPGVSEYDVAAALLARAGYQIAAAFEDPDACEEAFQDGVQAFERRLSRNTGRLRSQMARSRSRDRAIAEIQERIARQWLADQAGRLTYGELQTSDREGSAFWAQRLATAHAVTTDADSTVMMREILEQYDWIDSERFGSRIASNAWILVQHADDHPEFQAEVLERMEPYLESGGVRARDYAYLFDRVAVNTGQLQRYGTQPMDACESDGRLVLKPVEAMETLDERRAEMGLGPYQAELDTMAAQRCR